MKSKATKKKRPAKNIKIDKQRKAKRVGVRVSKSGNEYTETRPNRSDKDRRKKI